MTSGVRPHPLLALALLLLATSAAYAPAVNGGLLWDDDAHIKGEPGMSSWRGLQRIWLEPGATQQYYPLLHTALWLQHRAWGDAVVGYHLANVVEHALVACLFGMILLEFNLPGAWFIAAVFALHPVHVESVAWISQQKNTLSGVFFCISILGWLRFDADRRRRWLIVSLISFLASLLAKSSTAPLPVVFLTIVWWRRGSLEWTRDVRPLLPFFACGAAAGIVTSWVERTYAGATGSEFALTLAERLLVAGRAFFFYLSKLIVPTDLLFIYPRWEIDAGAPVGYLYPIAALAIVAAAWRARRWSRGPFAALVAYLAMLAPALGFVDLAMFIHSYVTDHWQYLASMALLPFLSCAWSSASRLALRGSVVPIALGLLLLLGVLSARQAGLYVDAETINRATIAGNPGSWMAHYNLGVALAAGARSDEAATHFEETIRLHSTYAPAYNNLGALRLAAGRAEEATRLCEEAAQLDPGSGEALNNLGAALIAAGRPAEAITPLRKALSLTRDLAKSHNNLGVALAALGRHTEAVEHYAEVLRRSGDADGEVRYNLGTSLVAAGRLEEGRARLEEALQRNPSNIDARHNLGIVLLRTGRVPEAIEEFRAVLRADPEHGRASRALAEAERLLGGGESEVE